MKSIGGGGAIIPVNGCGNIKVSNPSKCSVGPPLTAIERFLWAQQSHTTQQPPQNVVNKIHASALDGFGGSTYNIVWNNGAREVNFVEQLLANEVALNWTQQVPPLCLKEDLHVSGKNRKRVGRRPKEGSSVPLIKGQWTEEEDRLRNYENKSTPFITEFNKKKIVSALKFELICCLLLLIKGNC